MTRPPGGRSFDASMFRAALVPVVAVGAVVAAGSAVAAGAPGLVGAALGTALVVVFFGAGLLVGRWTARRSPTTVMGVAILSYAGKVALLGLFLVLFRGTDRFDAYAFAVSVIVCAIVWLVAEVRVMGRMRVPLDLTVPPAGDRERPT